MSAFKISATGYPHKAEAIALQEKGVELLPELRGGPAADVMLLALLAHLVEAGVVRVGPDGKLDGTRRFP